MSVLQVAGDSAKLERKGFRSRVRSLLNRGKSAAPSLDAGSEHRLSEGDDSRSQKQSLELELPLTRWPSGAHRETNATLWEKAQELVRENNRKEWSRFTSMFKSTDLPSFDDIIERLKAAIQECEDHKWRIPMLVNGAVFTPRDVLDKVVGYAEAFKEVGSTVASVDPTQSAGLAWNALQFLVNLAVKNQTSRDLVDKHETISNLVFRCSIYVALYVDVEAYDSSDELTGKLRDAILMAYTRILVYLMAALNFIGKGKIRKYSPFSPSIASRICTYCRGQCRHKPDEFVP